MREIKFRAWDRKNKRMFEVDSISSTGRQDGTWEVGTWDFDDELNSYIIHLQGCTCDEHADKETPFNNDIELLQYTGLKDSKGREIFESDIVKIGNMNWQILWDLRNAQFAPHTIDDITTSNHISSGAWPMRSFNWIDCGESVNLRDIGTTGKVISVEVIGNIWENAELLT